MPRIILRKSALFSISLPPEGAPPKEILFFEDIPFLYNYVVFCYVISLVVLYFH